ncbi:MAG TPA: hypothetical protein VKB54_19150, partial [Solirubrobacteraceae bacterium]|nr:hypothetical protein [Solirubrobacteraceae bacterium]
AMSKELDGQPIAPGSASFTATIVNRGPHDSPGGTFADLVPTPVDNAVATVAGGSCTTSGHIASCSLPAMPAGGSVDVKVSGTVPTSAAAEPLLNGIQAIPRAFSPDPPPGASNQPGDVVGPAADVGVAKVGTPDPAPRGGEVTYHVRATNHGPTTATRVVVRDTLPAGVRFVRSSRCTASARTVRCSLGTIRADRSVTFDITVRAPAASTRALANTITIDAAQRDPASANNRDRASTPIAAQLRLRKSATPNDPRVGATVHYTLRVSNPGRKTARNVVLCDRLGAGLTLNRAAGSRRQGRARCWSLGTLRPGTAVNRQLTATVTSASRGARRNAASVSTSGTRVAAASTTVRVPRQTPPAKFTG